MTDVVIPYFLVNDGLELRYALRSLERYLEGIGNVFIVGDKPDWLSAEAIHIPVKDGNRMHHKERNIYQKILAACNDARVSDTFLCTNDDIYLLKEYHAGTFPFYGGTSLGSQSTLNGPYGRTLDNTLKLVSGGATFFDVHTPIAYEKKKFLQLPANWPEWGYCLKTLYCNQFHIERGKYIADNKIRKPLTAQALVELMNDVENDFAPPIFSVDDRALNKPMQDYLQVLFPTKSKFEL